MLTPAIRAGKGWRGRRELAPRCSATQLAARRHDPGQTRRVLNYPYHHHHFSSPPTPLLLPHLPHPPTHPPTHTHTHTHPTHPPTHHHQQQVGSSGITRKLQAKYIRMTVFPCRVFLFGRNSLVMFWGLVVWHLWIGRGQAPGPGSQSFAIEVFNVDGWLSHGDFAPDVEVDFSAVVEHRPIPATLRCEAAGLRDKGVASVWGACFSRIFPCGACGCGGCQYEGCACFIACFCPTAQFRRFFDCGRAVRCSLPLGESRFIHLVVLHGYQERIAMLSSLIVGDFNVEPTKIPCLHKGISAEVWVGLGICLNGCVWGEQSLQLLASVLRTSW